MLDVITLEEAISLLKETIVREGLKYLGPGGTELIPTVESGGRILAESVFAADDIPAFNRSTVDGYAVRAADTFGASQSLPAVLVYDGEIEMGRPAHNYLQPGHCQEIPTGGALPDGADAVIMLEDVENEDDGCRYMLKPVSPGNNLIFRGDDVSRGSELLTAGTCLLPHHIGALAAAGIAQVLVKRRIKAAVISTGNELVPIGEKLSAGKVFDANAPMLTAMLTAKGVMAVDYGIVPDDFTLLSEKTGKAWKECDLVIISGGSSAGARDHVSSVIASLGKPGLLQHGLAVKPGKPTLIGFADQVPVIGLPGHPVAACLMAQLLVLPLIDWLKGKSTRDVMNIEAKLLDRIPANHGRQSFIPVRLNYQTESVSGLPSAEPLHIKSGLITALRGSDGYVVVDRNSEGLDADTNVQVVLWEAY
jgi:molybdopterin molybdotransferase